ncbi:MAG: hypothetical protein AAF982_05495 [Pseudomonadota bacterium]
MRLAARAARQSRHTRSKRWIPILGLHFTPACVGAYKALYEAIFAPFRRDRTTHDPLTDVKPSDPG